MMIVSNRKKAARLRKWRVYAARCDRLAPPGLSATTGCLHAVKWTPGHFRAEGWDLRARSLLRHGA